MASLAHTQVRFTELIQISNVVGEYGVDFLIVAVAAAITSVIMPPRKYLALAPAAILVAGAIAYGHWQLSHTNDNADKSSLRSVRIALIQGNTLADWRFDAAKRREIMDQYVDLSDEALTKAKQTGDGRAIDLMVWPETTFRSGLREFDTNFRLPPGYEQTPEEIAAVGPHDLAALATRLNTPILVGIDRIHFIADDAASGNAPRYHAYNSSALVDRDGKILGTYDKCHLVMFGEYIPFANWFPFLYDWLPITGGTEPGDGPKALCVGGVCYSPNTCYETAIPHVIRDQVATLGAARPTAGCPRKHHERRLVLGFQRARYAFGLRRIPRR